MTKRKSTKVQEEFEDTKGVIRIRISKKNRQHNDQKKKYKRTRRVWRYQRDNQNPYIEEEQTTQWPKEKVQKDKQRSTKHTYKTKDRVTRTPLKTGGELRCSGRVGSSCYTSGTRRVNLVTQHRLTRGKLPVPKTMTHPSFAVCVIELNPLLMNRQYI